MASPAKTKHQQWNASKSAITLTFVKFMTPALDLVTCPSRENMIIHQNFEVTPTACKFTLEDCENNQARLYKIKILAVASYKARANLP